MVAIPRSSSPVKIVQTRACRARELAALAATAAMDPAVQVTLDALTAQNTALAAQLALLQAAAAAPTGVLRRTTPWFSSPRGSSSQFHHYFAPPNRHAPQSISETEGKLLLLWPLSVTVALSPSATWLFLALVAKQKLSCSAGSVAHCLVWIRVLHLLKHLS